MLCWMTQVLRHNYVNADVTAELDLKGHRQRVLLVC